MGLIYTIYLIAIFLAGIVISIYGIRTKNNASSEALKKEISNRDKPISRGTKYFKIVNRCMSYEAESEDKEWKRKS